MHNIADGSNDSSAQQVNAALLSKSQADSLSGTSLVNVPKPQLFCKIKPPQNQFKLACSLNPINTAQLLKTLETSMESIGVGMNNCLTKANLELKMQLAEKAFNLQLDSNSVSQITGVSNFDLPKM